MSDQPGPSGFLVVDKPADWTSHDVVARLRRAAGTRRVGHAGTLDPMATGVLVLGLGWATRLLNYVVGADKSYEATIRLGVTTLTDDAAGEILRTADASGCDDAAIDAAIAGLTGPIDQVPSSVSAIKVNGQRAYARVRAGEQVALAARRVLVSRFQTLARRRADTTIDLDVAVSCSSGTYVRALARDLGAALGVGGHLTALRRTRVGPFELARASELATLTADPGQLRAAVLSMATIAGLLFDTLSLPAAAMSDLRHGRTVACPEPGGAAQLRAGDNEVVAVVDDGQLVALVRWDGAGLRPVAVVPLG